MDRRFKVEFYDDFKCTADQCGFTCCRGWDISVDPDTYDRWSSDKEQAVHFNNNIRSKKHGKKLQYSLKMDPEKGCPFFNKDGLCGIVLEYGESYQPRTCRIFPRQENVIGGIKESSLTCACPAVVDILFGINRQVQFLREGETTESSSSSFKIREAMIVLIQDNRFAFRDRLMLTFHMLLSIREEKSRVEEIIKNYRDESHLQSVMKLWEGIDIELTDSYQEVNELFIDIVQNYRKEKTYRQYLQGIYDLASNQASNEASNITFSQTSYQVPNQAAGDFHSKWKNFSEAIGQYDLLTENILVTKLFANCNCTDIDDIIMAFQLAVTEYLMVRHSVFLVWLLNRKEGNTVSKGINGAGINRAGSIGSESIDREGSTGSEGIDREGRRSGISSQGIVNYTKLKDFIVIYSRIIEYNSEGIREFWLESYDEAIWELGYLLLLIC